MQPSVNHYFKQWLYPRSVLINRSN